MKYLIRCNDLNRNETGNLEINVMDNRSIPISNAKISISRISYTGLYNEGAEGIVIAEYYTDNSGTIHVEMPVLNELIGIKDFYSAKVSKEGYYDVFIYYIQIYPNIDASYDVHLIPRTQGVERYRLLFQPQRRRVHEH